MESSGGGVTFCGGEPLAQYEFLASALKRCIQSGFHTAVDTSLYAPESVVREIAGLCDLFLVDLKVMDRNKHIKFCGVPNDRILDNLRILSDMGKEVIIRIPLVEGVNCERENLDETARFLKSLNNIREVELLNYHDIGIGKHAKLGTVYNPENFQLSPVSDQEIKTIGDLFNS